MTAVPSKEVTTRQVSAVKFGFYDDEEVLKLSVKRITNPIVMDGQGNPRPDGLYDPALGPIDKNGRCTTCTLSHSQCPGHFGHIQLPVPVYNPLIFNMLYRLLRQQCHFCHHLRLDREEVRRFETKLALLCSGRLTDAVAMQVSKSSLPKDLAELVSYGVMKGGADLLHEADGVPATGTKLTSLTLEAIQDTISELFARIPVGRCRNCDAHSPSVKKQGCSRIFSVWSSGKAVTHNARIGRALSNVLETPGGKDLEELEDAMAAQISASRAKRQSEKKDKKGKKGGKKGDKSDDKDGVKAYKPDGDDDDEDEDDEGGGGGVETVEQLEAEIAEGRAKAWGGDAAATELKLDMKPRYMSPMEVEARLQRLWEKEWRLLALVFGPNGDMWGQGDSVRRAGGRGSHLAGIRLTAKSGQLVVKYSAEAEAAAKKCWKMFFLRTLPVAPNKFRPPSVMNEQMFDHPQNTSLQRVLVACLELNSIKETLATQQQLANVVNPEQVRALELARMLSQWLALQDAVSSLMDTTMAENAPEGSLGIRQALEKKEGLFRKNMMGKRVNFAARSVISPDPYIGTGEIGIPPYFAQRLCYPERVTPWNVEKLREAVRRGPNQLNGAVAIEDESRRLINLKTLSDTKREALARTLLANTDAASSMGSALKSSLVGGAVPGGAKPAGFKANNKIVYRHLQDGDLMLTNRQPTLHKPGLMAHRARVLKGEKTIRMHYANCSTFNADFDGDEINLHLPQDEHGRAEGYGIVHADHQFNVPTDGKPIRGLIQDHVVSGVLLTKRDTWLDKSEYTQLVYLACSAWRRSGSAAEGPDTIELEPPAIMAPRQLWSGKQVVSTVVRFYTHGKPPLTFSAGGKVPADYWGKTSGEAELVFHKGYMVSGCIDKNQFGKFGLVHAIQEMYGGPVAGALLSSFSRLFTAYLQWHGFTCGFDDLLLNQQVEDKRKTILSRAEAIAIRASAEFVGEQLPETWAAEPLKYQDKLQAAQAKVNSALSERYRASRTTGAAHDMKGSGVMHPLSSEVVKACLPAGQIKPFPGNCLSLMTISGAKGSLVNFSQISCLLGQQELEGRRVPRMASGATLPCFAPYDGGARSCGFVGDRFLSGLRPQEYYFHCMAGREGLIDTTVKTSRSGYLQRCLIKNLETLRVHYDYTVRDNADGSIVQFYYGDDGLDVTQVSYMGQLGFLAKNAPRFSQALNRPAALAAGQHARMGSAEDEVRSAWKSRAKQLGVVEEGKKSGDAGSVKAAMKKLEAKLPLQATYPATILGATSEAFMDKLLSYITSNPDGLLDPDSNVFKSSKDKSDKGDKSSKKKSKASKVGSGKLNTEEFFHLMCLKYMKSLAAPGEAVGVLAAQSVGEPSTQMTLNTFHMAGRGEANVTLGIPRLREILMTAAAKIKTPVMTLPIRAGMGVTEANVLAGRMRRLRLAECVSNISVQEQPVCPGSDLGSGYGRLYVITLKFFNPSQFPAEAGITFKELADVFLRAFCNKLRAEVDKEVKRKSGSSSKVQVGKVDTAQIRDEETAGAATGGAAGGEDGDGEAGGSSRSRAKRGQTKEADVEEGQEQQGGDEEEEEEQDEEMVEGKMRFRGVDDDTTYDAPDQEDQEAATAAAAQARKRALVVEGGNADDSSDDDVDDNEEGQQEVATAPLVSSTKSSKASKAQAKASATAGLVEMEEHDSGDIDYINHTCRVAVRLPLRAPKLLMLEIVERVAAAVMVRETRGIDKVYVLPGDRGEGARVQTDGVNFEGVWQHMDLVDVTGITTNDVAAMLRTYGVEAARATILKEVQSVFAAYGIGVDPRHLGLIADFMTHQGGYRACNRIGIESSVSPFLKMSFETAAHFLTDATLRQSADDLSTPSARLCVGRVVELGSGVVSIMQNM